MFYYIIDTYSLRVSSQHHFQAQYKLAWISRWLHGSFKDEQSELAQYQTTERNYRLFLYNRAVL